MQIGIIGLPSSGKTTIFNAITHGQAAVGNYSSASAEPNVSIVKVPDERLDRLSAIFIPKKTVPADVQITDVAGLTKGSAASEGFSRQFTANISKVDALLHVVRVFEDPNITHPDGNVDPLRDIETVNLELLFSDLASIEKRITRLGEGIKKIKAGPEREANEKELALLIRLKPILEDNRPLRDIEIGEEELRLIKGFQFLTLKPQLILLNIGEDQLGKTAELLAKIQKQFPYQKTLVTDLSGKLEMEMAQLSAEDAEVFMQDLGIKELGRERVIKLSYETLGLLSFFTAGTDECRAWTIKLGTNAQQAAGEIHSDLERGFIRAAVVSYNDFIRTGSMAEAKKQGVHRLEGKTYIVQDGDIMEIMHSS